MSYLVTCAKCPTRIRHNKSGLCIRCYTKFPGTVDTTPAAQVVVATPAERMAFDRENTRLKAEFDGLKHKYKAALQTIEHQETALGWLEEIRKGVDTTYKIEAREGSGTSEATPIVVASDWHSEEIVKPAQVNGLNEFNLDIFEKRATRFWQSSLRLIRLLNQDVKITTVVLGLLGDFITNDIHDAENSESNGLLPIDAIINVQSKIIAGIEFWLNHSTYNFIIPCKVGNHSRTTKTTRYASESGHSLETLMYVHLVAHFRNEPRVKFIIDDSYLTYLNVYDLTIRFHHGHELKYAGGIGGIFIPAFKAVAQWDKGRQADLDIFGHFHQSKDGGKFMCNGSLIGYNAYAIRNKFDFEPPQQQLVLIDKKRRRTFSCPVLLK